MTGVAEIVRFVVMAAVNDVSVFGERQKFQVSKLCRMEGLEHDGLFRGVFTDDVVGAEHDVIYEIFSGNGWLVEDFQHQQGIGELV